MILLDAAELITPHTVEVAFSRFKCQLLAKNEAGAISATGALAAATAADTDVLRVRHAFVRSHSSLDILFINTIQLPLTLAVGML